MKTIGVPDETQKRIKILSAKTEKKIYELVNEAISRLEEKYYD